MADTKIEWAEKTWNPVTGCTKISPGCKNCYAERMAHRLQAMGQQRYLNGFKPTCHPDILDEPMRWRKPSRIFVCSMADLFHDDIPIGFITNVLLTAQMAQQHTFLILTKRPERMKKVLSAIFAVNVPLPNLWLGVTAENQEQADKRIPVLLQIPAAKRFVSVEPMLGPVDLTDLSNGENAIATVNVTPGLYGLGEQTEIKHGLDWVICGGESGPGARPMHPDWVRSLRDQCQAANVPFLFKQWGEWAPWMDEDKFTHDQDQSSRNEQHYVNHDGTTGSCWLYDADGTWTNWTGEPEENCCVVSRLGKKKAGRLLDGQLWDQYPEVK